MKTLVVPKGVFTELKNIVAMSPPWSMSYDASSSTFRWPTVTSAIQLGRPTTDLATLWESDNSCCICKYLTCTHLCSNCHWCRWLIQISHRDSGHFAFIFIGPNKYRTLQVQHSPPSSSWSEAMGICGSTAFNLELTDCSTSILLLLSRLRD